MGWFGKVAGATIGFIIGGPLGAAGGAYLGHKFLDSDNNLSSKEKIQANYFVALFSMLGKMAKADGIVTPEEIKVVDNVIRKTLKFSEEQREFAINIFNEAKDSNYSFDSFATNFYSMSANQPDLIYFMLNTLFEIAMADGKLHPNEEVLLEKARVIFRISNTIYDSIKNQFLPKVTIEKQYAILNCKPDDSEKTIKSNYRKLVQEFHPDKIEQKGLPEEFREYAKVKFQAIQDAYEKIRELRGF